MIRRFQGKRLVLASHNAGKLKEIAELLEPFGIAVSSASEFGLTEPEETETTFEGNARIKAHYAAKETQLPSLSDDSGLIVDTLDGDPGVYTADWAETPNGRDFGMAMEKVWSRCQRTNVPQPWTARFACCLCLAWPDGHDEVFMGYAEGTLVWPPRGENGFGYDPMFLAVGEHETFGEMDPSRKHSMSHRAHAFEKLRTACFA